MGFELIRKNEKTIKLESNKVRISKSSITFGKDLREEIRKNGGCEFYVDSEKKILGLMPSDNMEVAFKCNSGKFQDRLTAKGVIYRINKLGFSGIFDSKKDDSGMYIVHLDKKKAKKVTSYVEGKYKHSKCDKEVILKDKGNFKGYYCTFCKIYVPMDEVEK